MATGCVRGHASACRVVAPRLSSTPIAMRPTHALPSELIERIQCCICETTSSPRNRVLPAYAGPICSLCCSLDARCQDLCKPHARAQAPNVRRRSANCLPKPIYGENQSAARPLSPACSSVPAGPRRIGRSD